ncbi:phosphotransferase family protein [Kribbella sp. NPDC055071]
MEWQPESDWIPLTAGTGVSNGGVWRTPDGLVAKRLLPGVEQPNHYAYWRRQAEVAGSGLVETTAGLRAPHCLKVDRDADGITVWTVAVDPGFVQPVELADALGQFGVSRFEPAEWFADRILRDRLANDERRGGWTPLLSADLPAALRHHCEQLWVRRSDVMAELDRLPQQVIHGDAHPGNLLRRDGDHVIATDWEQFGIGPLGFDLAYLLLSTDHPIDELLTAYQRGSASSWPAPVVRRGTVLITAVTLVARAAWSLGQPDPGDHVERLLRLSDVMAEAVTQAS